MTRNPAIFLGLETDPNYRQPIMCFRRPDDHPMKIGLPEGEMISIPAGSEVEFTYLGRVWTTISYRGQVVVRNPRMIA